MLEQFLEALIETGHMITVDKWGSNDYLTDKSTCIESILNALKEGDYVIVYNQQHKRIFSLEIN